MEKLRVLYLSSGCSMTEKKGMAARFEYILSSYCSDTIEYAVAFDSSDEDRVQTAKDGCVYFPIKRGMSLGTSDEDWEEAKRALLGIIDSFKPDIIHCFGSEWAFGLIAEAVDIPVIIHMMGFLNIYYPSLDMAAGFSEEKRKNDFYSSYSRSVSKKERRRIHIKKRLGLIGEEYEEEQRKKIIESIPERHEEMISRRERRIMRANRYFMGRTEWDRHIVRYYSPNSNYYHVAEPIRQRIYNAAGKWKYRNDGILKLLTISIADDRKGNEIILRTAQILKDRFDIDFEWKVAGRTDCFEAYERRTGIEHEDVNVKLIGIIQEEEIIRELSYADFFIHPSIMDNSSNAICEAQLIGCPVIASNVGGTPQIVEDGVTGYLYPYNEPHTLAFIIMDHYKDEKALSELSRNEVICSMKRHDPKLITDTLKDVYKRVIEDY